MITTADHPVKSSHPKRDAAPDAPATPRPREERIVRSFTEDHICILTLDRPHSPVNLFDRDTLEELIRHLSDVAEDRRLKGLVLISAKPGIFVAGADIKALASGASPQEVSNLIALGQSAFNRLNELRIPTVAAIHGACVGGGYEVCLACDYRMASPERATKIGLPETLLGILPGWGGATRLPRLIGIPKALDIILAGKTMAAQAARKRGLIDEIVPREYLLESACGKIRSAGNSLKRRKPPLSLSVMNSRLAATLISRKVRKTLLEKTRGHYPAVLKALDVVTKGVNRSVGNALLMERESVTELSQTPACRNLIQLFFLQERAKKLGPKDASALRKTNQIAVIGAGVMGAGIAQWASSRGVHVLLRDINAAAIARGMDHSATLYSQAAKRHVMTPVEARAGMDRITPSATEVPLRNIDLIIEAAVETMDLKKRIFARLDELAGPDTILATNTSALSVSEIASATRRPDRVVGIHFFNPVHRMQLVEVVRGEQTHPTVLDQAVHFVQQLGKLPVMVADRPGFLVNRILMPYLIEAGNLFERGASVENIDEAMLEFGMPMGPLRLIDEVGVDVAHHVALTLAGALGDRLHIPPMLRKLKESGQLGRKSGGGFYQHDGKTKHPPVSPDIQLYQTRHGASALSREELQQRMVLLIINEAARCLEESVVAAPEDVDFGMVMGTGFAPFRGGPLRMADAAGLQNIVDQMHNLVARDEPHFEPCQLLLDQARAGKNFFQWKGTVI